MSKARSFVLGPALLPVLLFAFGGGGMEPSRPAGAAPDIRWESFSAPGGAFTVDVPAGWERAWTHAAGWDSPSELMVSAPGQVWPGYVAFTVIHYGQVYRTPERYLFDLKHDLADRKDGPSVTEAAAKVAGRAASRLEAKIKRYPPIGMEGEPVPSVVRHVVVPAGRGFFVLRYDVPEAADPAYRAAFDHLVGSFKPAAMSATTAPDPIAPAEYEVYAALFAAKAPGGINSPQFFEAVLDGRLVDGATLALKEPLPAGWPGRDFGPLEPELIKDYRAKNTKEWPLTDRILVPRLRVMPREELEARLRAALNGPEADALSWMGLDSGFIGLSRVGFNAAGDAALLNASFTTPRAMSATYLVLMKKQAGSWRLDQVVMEDLIYH